MENATKALIIAAAILIAIVLISLGVYVLGIGQNAIQGADMTESEITTFNAKFESYGGNNVMGSKVNSLLQAIATNNTTQGDSGKTVSLAQGSTGAISGNRITKVETGQAYSVTFERNNTGLIYEVDIQPLDP